MLVWGEKKINYKDLLCYQVMVHAMKKNDLGKVVENDKETTLKTVVRGDFSEEAIFAQEPEWIWKLVIWIHVVFQQKD